MQAGLAADRTWGTLERSFGGARRQRRQLSHSFMIKQTM